MGGLYCIYSAANRELAEKKCLCARRGAAVLGCGQGAAASSRFSCQDARADVAPREEDGDGGRRNASSWFGGGEGILLKREPPPRQQLPTAAGSPHFPSPS